MSKSELKRQCTQNPLDAAERIAELEQRVKVLTDAMKEAVSIHTNADDTSDRAIDVWQYMNSMESVLHKALNATPQQTAEQIERVPVAYIVQDQKTLQPYLSFAKHTTVSYDCDITTKEPIPLYL